MKREFMEQNPETLLISTLLCGVDVEGKGNIRDPGVAKLPLGLGRERAISHS